MTAGSARAAGWAPLLPFVLLLAVLPFPGTVALRLLCLVAAAGIAGYRFLRAGERTALPCKAALAAWIAVCAASLLYSAIPDYSANEFKNEIGYTMLAFGAFLVAARDEETVERLLLGLAAGFAAIGLWAAGAWFAHGFFWDQSGGYGGIAVFVTYIVTAAPALFWLAAAGSTPAVRRAAWALLALAFALALMTLQRAAWPALAAQFAVVVAWRYRRGHRSGHETARIAVAAALILAAFLAASAWRSGERTVERDLAQDPRLAAWRSMVAKVAEHPLIGAGFGRGTMGRAYPELIPEATTLISHPHNVFLNYAIGMGLPGLLAVAALFFCLARRFWKLAAARRDDLALAGVCGLMLVIGVVVRNQFNDLFIRDMALLFWALAGTLLGPASRLSANLERQA